MTDDSNDEAIGYAEAMEELDATRTLRSDLVYRTAAERAGSRTPEAIDALLDTPLMGIVALQAAVALTHRGANMMLKRLVGAGVVRPFRIGRAKGRLFVCDRALRRQA